MDRQADGPEVLFHQAREHIGSGPAHHVAETRIGLGEEGGFIQRGRILEADKLHRLLLPGCDDFTGYPPAHRRHPAADIIVKIRAFHTPQF